MKVPQIYKKIGTLNVGTHYRKKRKEQFNSFCIPIVFSLSREERLHLKPTMTPGFKNKYHMHFTW